MIADLEDQAEWSSYTQHIPRLGNPYRENLRLNRMNRFYRGIVRPRGQMASGEMGRIARVLGILIGIVALVWFIYSFIRVFVP